MPQERIGLKILIVDDEECIRDCLTYVFTKRGFIAENASNGEEALEKISQDKPDIIILDIAMPVMDGIQLCRNLKDNPDNWDIPIIFLSAFGQEGAIREIHGLPGAGIRHIEKPCDLKYLFSQISSLIFWPQS
jgi:CheY-like chemotaxis protein